ncbi:hemin uptake protein HemP [Aurantimonas sp. A2-1-M11]
MASKLQVAGGHADRRKQTLPVLNAADLFSTGREILIRHADDIYRLRLTSNNKLILTK